MHCTCNHWKHGIELEGMQRTPLLLVMCSKLRTLRGQSDDRTRLISLVLYAILPVPRYLVRRYAFDHQLRVHMGEGCSLPYSLQHLYHSQSLIDRGEWHWR